MNWKKLILLSYVAPAFFAISTTMAAQRMMQSSPMRPAHRSTATRTSIMTNSATRFNRFSDRDARFNRFHRFNDFDRDDRFRFRRFNDFVFVDFGFPFFYPYPYYYPYGYYYYNQPAYGNVSIVVEVQTRLARAGYYHGAVDGVMGPRTRYAIRAYERTHGLRVDGVISQQLMATMGLRAGGGGY